jgi:hypothetical protein
VFLEPLILNKFYCDALFLFKFNGVRITDYLNRSRIRIIIELLKILIAIMEWNHEK